MLITKPDPISGKRYDITVLNIDKDDRGYTATPETREMPGSPTIGIGYSIAEAVGDFICKHRCVILKFEEEK